MSLLRLKNAHLAFGDDPLLNSEELNIHKAERLCLVGRNGCGKSTLLKVIMGEIILDDGAVEKQQHLTIAKLEQDPPESMDKTVYEFVSEGLSDIGSILAQYFILVNNSDIEKKQLVEMDQFQHKIDAIDGWNIDYKIKSILELLKIDPVLNLKNLSGGWKRKVALAKAIISEPDILLLDEPTNHLDMDTITWLEDFLKKFEGAIVFISHDRSFISKLATRIIDLDRGYLTSWHGNYEKFLQDKEESLRIEQEKNNLFDKRLAQEEDWIRQGIKARRTRNEGRVRRLEALRKEHDDRRKVKGNVNFSMQNSHRSGKIIFELENVSYSIDDKKIIQNFSCIVSRGDKIALVGKNGSGKSTLVKLLLEEIKQTEGEIKFGTNQSIAYFDQYREQLNPESTVIDNLADGKQEVTINGKTKHALSYLQDFMFTPKRARSPVHVLSGGEKNRLLLAKLFLIPSNIIILDEPTNDLDIETLELLEDLITQYKGTVIIVSHDRYFLDNTVTSTWFFDNKGDISIYPGGYSSAREQLLSSHTSFHNANEIRTLEQKEKKEKKEKKNNTKNKLSYKEKKELEQLPEKIDQLEQSISVCQNKINQPSFFTQSNEETKIILEELNELEVQLQKNYDRWESLEELQKSFN